jgi:hypothetical protein
MAADVDLVWLMSPSLANRGANSPADEDQDGDTGDGASGEETAAEECGGSMANNIGAPTTTWWHCWWLAATSVIPAIRQGQSSASIQAAPHPAPNHAGGVRVNRVAFSTAGDDEERSKIFRTPSAAPSSDETDDANDENQASESGSACPPNTHTYARNRGKVNGNRRRRLNLD